MKKMMKCKLPGRTLETKKGQRRGSKKCWERNPSRFVAMNRRLSGSGNNKRDRTSAMESSIGSDDVDLNPIVASAAQNALEDIGRIVAPAMDGGQTREPLAGSTTPVRAVRAGSDGTDPPDPAVPMSSGSRRKNRKTLGKTVSPVDDTCDVFVL